MKRLFSWLAAAIFVAALLPMPCKAIGVSAEHAILLDAVTGRVLYEKNPDGQSLIASTTKIMTALVVCEQCNVLDRVKIMPEAVGIEGSSMYLQEGEILTVQELLYGMMLHSGNDAAVALAVYCGGTVEGFAGLMNDTAHRIGLRDTHFENPNGLDSPNHYSTARDLAILAAYAMENPIFSQTVGTKSLRIGQRYLTNHNKLLWRYPGAEGVKTGYTRAAGRILVSSAQRDGRRLIAVTINAPDDWNDHERMLNYGFSQFEVKQLVKKGESLGSCEVFSHGITTVQVLSGVDFSYSVGKDETFSVKIPGPGFAFGPVTGGESAGFAYALVDGKPVGKILLVWGTGVGACSG